MHSWKQGDRTTNCLSALQQAVPELLYPQLSLFPASWTLSFEALKAAPIFSPHQHNPGLQ